MLESIQIEKYELKQINKAIELCERVIHFLEDTGMTNTELYRETQQLYLLCQE